MSVQSRSSANKSSMKRNNKNQKPVEKDCSKYSYFDTLTLRQPPSTLVASVARPRRATLHGGLPLWNMKTLDSKLPLMNGPDGPFAFSRGKLGEKLWKGAKTTDFHLSDPYGHEVKFNYEPAHDHHLRNWLRRPYVLKTLRVQDLITPQLRVKCSVQEYNNFRQFLYTLYRDALRYEADRKEHLNMERLMINKANENSEKEILKLKKIEESESKRKSNLNRLEEIQLERLKNCRKRLERVIAVTARAEARKEVEVVERKKRMEAYDEKIKSRIVAANYIERMSKIKTMKAWHKQDVEKKREFEKRKQERDLDLKNKAEKRWKRKIEEEEKQIVKEKCLYGQRRKEIENFKQQYMKAMQKEWSRLEDQLSVRKYSAHKCQSSFDKVKKDKRSKSMKQIMHSVTTAYSQKKSIGVLSQDENTLGSLMDHVQATLKEIRYDLEPYIVISHAKGRLEKQENVPLPVSGAIKYLLEQSIVEYTAKQLSSTVTNTAKKMLTAIDELKNVPIPPDKQSISIKRSSLYGMPRNQSISSARTAQISAIEEVIPVQKTRDELIVGAEDLRSTKDRIATPMPSITTLTEVLFNELDNEEFADEDFGEFSFIEQKKLVKSINSVSNRISRMVTARVRAVIERRSYDRVSTAVSSTSVPDSVLPENKPVAKLCSLILFEESIRDDDLVKVLDNMILNFMQDIHMSPSYLRLKIKQKMEGFK